MYTRSSVKRSFCRFDALAASLVLALAGAVALLFYGGRSGDALTATVTRDGETLGVYALQTLSDELILTPEELGYPLTIRLTKDGAEVTESSCPTQDCLHTGKITRSGESIICLPNRLVIQLSGGSGETVDAALG